MTPSNVEKRIPNTDESPETTYIPELIHSERIGDWQEVHVLDREVKFLLGKLPNDEDIELFISSLKIYELRDILIYLLREVISAVRYPDLYPLSCLYSLDALLSKTEDVLTQDIKSKSRLFNRLSENWHKDTDHHSFSHLITNHEAYLKIIAMGTVAIPFILQDLQERGGNWYVALRILSDQDPVPLESKGNVPLMNESWLQWGRDNGYIE